MPPAEQEEFGRFLDDAVHELRTPLTAIAGYAALLAEESGALDPALRGWVEVIEAQSARLGEQLARLLEIARLWSGSRARAQVRLDLAKLAREAGAGDPHLLVDAPRAVPVHGDAELLRRAVSELLANARLYGAPPIRVHTTRDGALARLSVEDRGEGIPEAFVPRAGLRPFRADSDGQRPGTGLGLVLVGAIARAHGGGLSYARADGVTRLTLTLPAAGNAARPRS